MIVESHPHGPAAGLALADDLSARLARAVEGLQRFPHMGRLSRLPEVLELVVPGPTRRLTFTLGYRLRDDRITVLGVTWAGRRFDPPAPG